MFIHEGFAKDAKEPKEGEVSGANLKNETSLKQVLKQKDYKKLEPVIAKLAKDETINIQEVMELKKKSRTTAWRYMQILVECGAVEAVGSTNNLIYRRLSMTQD